MNIWKDIWLNNCFCSTMMYIKKIFLLLIVAVIFWWCNNEYREHYQKQISFSEQKQQVTQGLENFQLQNIKHFQDIALYYTPQSENFNLISILTEKIDKAEKQVYLSSYIFTEKRVLEALKKAQKRWIDVRVTMEKNVYKAPFLNNSRYNELEKSGVNVAWSNPENYSLNHTKLLIIDDEAFISTGNYSYSSFAYNREFFIQIWDIDFVNMLKEIYLADYAWVKNTAYDDRLVLSPLLTRSKFSQLVDSAQKSIQIYSQTFSDDLLESQLSSAIKRWVEVEVIFPELSDISSNTESYNIFRNAWITVHTMKKPKLHAKAMLVDKKYLYIWSINFSYYSIEENREIWLLIANPKIIEKFLKVWEIDTK